MSLALLAGVLIPAVMEGAQRYCASTVALTAWVLVCMWVIFLSWLSYEIKVILISLLYWHYRVNIALFLGTSGILFSPSPTREMNQVRIRALLEEHFDISVDTHQLTHEPTLIVANYVKDRFENLFPFCFPFTPVIMSSKEMIDLTELDRFTETIPIEHGGDFELARARVLHAIQEGKRVFCYVQRPCLLENQQVGRYRRGVFEIAKTLNVSITPFYCDSIETQWGAVFRQPVRLLFGAPFRLGENQPLYEAIAHVRSFHDRWK